MIKCIEGCELRCHRWMDSFPALRDLGGPAARRYGPEVGAEIIDSSRNTTISTSIQ